MSVTRRPFEPTATTVEFTPYGMALFTLAFVTITMPPWDGGDPIDTVVLATEKFKTKMAPTLIDIGNMSFTAEYNPAAVATAPINVNGVIVVKIPGEGEFEVRGYLKAISPDELKVGERAMCSGEFVVTNTADDHFTEVAPKWTPAVSVTPTYGISNISEANLTAVYTGMGGDATGMTAEEIRAAVQAVFNTGVMPV